MVDLVLSDNFWIWAGQKSWEHRVDVIGNFVGMKQKDYFVEDKIFVQRPSFWILSALLSIGLWIWKDEVLILDFTELDIASHWHFIESVGDEDGSLEGGFQWGIDYLSVVGHINIHALDSVGHKEIYFDFIGKEGVDLGVESLELHLKDTSRFEAVKIVSELEGEIIIHL